MSNINYFMHNMIKNIGNFKKLAPATKRKKNSLLFHILDTASDSSCKAELHLLTSSQLKILSSGKVAPFLSNKHIISQLLLFSRHDRFYLAKLIDQHKLKQIFIDIQSIKISLQDCRRLMIQGLILIEELHSVGLKVKDDLSNYLQVELYNTHRITIPKISFLRDQILQQKFKLSKRQPEEDTLSREEVIALHIFYNHLIKATLKDTGVNINRLNKVMTFLKESVDNPAGVSFEQLKKIILTVSIDNKEYSMLCSLDYHSSKLFVEIYQKYNKKSYSFLEQNYVNNGKEGSSLTNLSFFSTISSKEDQQIEFLSQNQIGYIRDEDWEVITFTPSDLALASQKEDGKGCFEREQAEACMTDDPSSNSIISQCEREYPYNCVGRVQSHFHHKNHDKAVKGVGLLLSQKLVLTSAHVVCYRFASKGPRTRAFDVYFNSGWKNIKVIKFEYPLEFIEGKKQRQYDYALLYLEQAIWLPKYLGLAINYRTNAQIQLVKLQKQTDLNIVSMKMKKDIKNQQLLKHSLETKAGDSGSPIVVKVIDKSYYYAIAIHSADKFFTKISTKITGEMLNKLCDFQRSFQDKRTVAGLRVNTIEYEELVEAIKKMDRNIEQNFEAQKQFFQKDLQKMKDNYDKASSIAHDIDPSLTMTGKDFEVRFQSIHQKILQFDKQYQWSNGNSQEHLRKVYPQMSDKQIHKIFLQKDGLLKQTEQFQNHLNKLPADNLTRIGLSSILKKMVKLFNFSQQSVDSKWESCSLTENQEQKLLFSLPVLIGKKYLDNYVFYMLENLFFVRESGLNTYISSYEKALKLTGTPVRLGADLLKMQYQIEEARNRPFLVSYPIQINLYPPLLAKIIPFRCLNSPFFYPKLACLQLSFNLDFDCVEHRNSYILQQINVTHSRVPFTYPSKIVNNQESTYTAAVKFKTVFTFSLFDLRQLIKINLYSISHVIQLFLQITQYILYLHSKGCELCAPIEFCNFINPREGYLIFYFFGHREALYRKISRIDNQEVAEYGEYYPIVDILISKRNAENYQKIDVWMLGKSFQRYVEVLIEPLTNCEQFLTVFCDLTTKMTARRQERLSMQEVHGVLIHMLNTYK